MLSIPDRTNPASASHLSSRRIVALPPDLQFVRYSIDAFFSILVGSDAGGIQAVGMVRSDGSTGWLVDRRNLAGTPALQVRATGIIKPQAAAAPLPPPPIPHPQRGTLHVALSGARWPGTEAPADFSLDVFVVISFEDTTVGGSVRWALGNGSVDIDETYDGGVTAQMTGSGQVCGVGPVGAVSFTGGAMATATFSPGSIRISGGNILTVSGFGDTLQCNSLDLELLAPADPPLLPDTAVAPLRSLLTLSPAAAWNVALPFTDTTVGELSIVANRYDRLRIEAGEDASGARRQAALFDSSATDTQVQLTVGEGLLDVFGNPLVVPMHRCAQSYDFGVVPAATEVGGTALAGDRWAVSQGVGILLAGTADVQDNFRFLSADGQVRVARCDLPYRGVTIPLGEVMVEPLTVPGNLSLMPVGAIADPVANRNPLVVGTLANHDVRLFLRDFGFRVTRSADLLVLGFNFDAMALEAGVGLPLAITRTLAGQPGYITVTLPPQHLAEQALGETDAPPGTALAARLAGPSRLAFTVPGDSNPLALTLDNLLYWAPYALSVEPVCDDPPAPTSPSPPNGPNASSPPQTGVEMPWRLVLSPGPSAGFSHDYRPATRGEWTALWHTRLAARKATSAVPSGFFVDERDTADNSTSRMVRAVWSPDYAAPGATDPFAAPLTRQNRQEIVERDANLVNKVLAPPKVTVNRLMLSALGGWLDSRGAWDPDPGDPTNKLAEWRHIASQGRDQYVRIVARGTLFPFGHAASRVQVAERKFAGNADNTAYLRQREFLVVTQPMRDYAQASDWPFTRIEMTTLITPPLDIPPQKTPVVAPMAYWVALPTGQLFPLALRGWDLAGALREFSAPMIFIDEGAPVDAFNAARAAYDSPPSDSGSTVCPLRGQQLTFAPSAIAGDTTLEVESLTLATGPRAVPADPSRFYPRIAGAAVHLPAARVMAASGATGSVNIKYADKYLSSGFGEDNPVGLFAELLSPLNIGFSGDKSAGVAAPNMAISALSRTLGTVSGSVAAFLPPQGTVQNFDINQYFPDSATLLGGIRLKDLVPIFVAPPLTGSADDGVPQLKVDTSNPAQVSTLLNWKPKVTAKSFRIGILQFAFDKGGSGQPLGSFELQAQSTTYNADPNTGQPPPEPTAYSSGSIGNFTLAFVVGDAALATVHFSEFSFRADRGRKPDVKLVLAPDAVTLGGQLDFLQVLMKKLEGILGSGPSVAIDNGIITAGYAVAVPTISIGIFSLENIRVGASVVIPLSGADPTAFRFAFAEKDHPFTLTVDLLGGGGFFAVAVNSGGIENLELAVEAGANVAFDLAGLASGNAHVMVGVYFHYTPDTTAITGFLRAGAELTVLQLISLHVEFYAGLTYVVNEHVIYGSVSIMVDVAVGVLHTGVTLSLERRFPVSVLASGAGVARLAASDDGRVTVASVMTQDDWQQYAGAFA